MLDNLALLFVHGALAVLIWRLVRTPDPEDLDRPPVRRAGRFAPRSPGI